VLEVRGRKTGEPRRTPVNLLTLDGSRYLVAPRGQTHWVRNLRAQGEGCLLLGRRAERFSASELDDDDKLAILRAYLNAGSGRSASSSTASDPTRQTANCAGSRPTTRSSASTRCRADQRADAGALWWLRSRPS
jgi:deazaflavin-dependent oxidoreductase (nitroreductase family)